MSDSKNSFDEIKNILIQVATEIADSHSLEKDLTDDDIKNIIVKIANKILESNFVIEKVAEGEDKLKKYKLFFWTKQYKQGEKLLDLYYKIKDWALSNK